MVEQMVGRRQELATVEQFLLDDGGHPSALLIDGEAGIGKTRLWDEAVSRARASGCSVLVTRPAGAEVRLSFACLGDLLRDVAVEALPRLPTPQRRALEGALLLAEPLEAPDPRAVGVAVVEILRSLAITGRVVLAIDDLQWMDVPSGELLAFALRRLDGAAVRLLATVRSGTSSAVPFELDRALGDEHLRQLPLGPLSLGALHELVRTRLGVTLPRATLVRVHETSAGNPLLALELVRELHRRGLELRPGDPLPLPGDAKVLLRERLARLPRRTRGLLLAAAAHPRPTVTLLEEAIGDADTAAADLERSLQAGVIELEGEHVRFTHPLLASLCYTDASPLQRRRVHARFAVIVDDPEGRARHVALAADGEDEDVARSLEEAAGRAVGRGATQAAAELWELATAFTPPERADERRRRRRATAESRLQAGDLAGAVALLQQLVDETSAGADRAELLLLLANGSRGRPGGVDQAVRGGHRAGGGRSSAAVPGPSGPRRPAGRPGRHPNRAGTPSTRCCAGRACRRRRAAHCGSRPRYRPRVLVR